MAMANGMMLSAASVVVAIAFLGSAHAHICMINPPQRGAALPAPVGPGTHSCYIRTPYCGGRKPETPTFSLTHNSANSILFQQNLNHFNKDKPGRIDVAVASVADPTDDSDFTVVEVYDDFTGHDMVTQTNYSVSFMLPSSVKASNHGVLRIRYFSYNAGEVDPANNTDAIFYNCADVKIEAKSEKLVMSDNVEEKEEEESVPILEKGTSCLAPKLFHASAVESRKDGSKVANLNFFYDLDSKKVRIDRVGSGANMSTISLYGEPIPGAPPAAHPEFVMDMDTMKCELYGADPMYEWGYGADFNQELAAVGKTMYRSDGSKYKEMTFRSHDKLHYFTVEMNTDGTCLPVKETHIDNIVTFMAKEVRSFPEDTFKPLSSCKM